jgi:hypothetical protein
MFLTRQRLYSLVRWSPGLMRRYCLATAEVTGPRCTIPHWGRVFGYRFK